MTKGNVLLLGSNATRIAVQGGGTGPTGNYLNESGGKHTRQSLVLHDNTTQMPKTDCAHPSLATALAGPR